MNCRHCGTALPTDYQLMDHKDSRPVGTVELPGFSLMVGCPNCETWELVHLSKFGAAASRRVYSSPTLTFLGKVSDLTGGVGGNSPDGAMGNDKLTGQ